MANADRATPVSASAFWMAHHPRLLIPFLCVPLVLAGTGVRSWAQLQQPSGSSQSPSRSDGTDLHAAKASVSAQFGSQGRAGRTPDISNINGTIGIGESHVLKGPTLSGLGAQQQARRALGSLNTSGEVYVNNSPAPSQSTIFAGDTVRTGERGFATFTSSGEGSLGMDSKTEMFFAGDPQYIAELHHGAVALHFLVGSAKFQLRVSNFTVIAESGAEATAEVQRTAEGSARVTCRVGSVGVIELGGPQVVFLKPEQSVSISSEGKLESVALAPVVSPPAPTEVRKGRRTAWIVLGLAAGGGAAGAAVALASGGGRRTVSPSSP